MNKAEFKKILPGFEEWTNLTTDVVHTALLRSAGFLEAVEGFKQNPEMATRMNLNELKLLQAMVKLVFSLQCQILDMKDADDRVAHLNNENIRLHEGIAHATDMMNKAVEERNALESELTELKAVCNQLVDAADKATAKKRKNNEKEKQRL